MSGHNEQKQDPLAEAGDLMGVRFERLNVLAGAINDLADENRNTYQVLKLNEDLASQIQSAAAFITRELREAEQEFDRALNGGEA